MRLARSKSLPDDEPPAPDATPGYERDRLWLGISGVGTIAVERSHSHRHVHGPGLDHGHTHPDFPAGDHAHEHSGH